MYNDDVNRIPKDEDELWDVLWEQFEFVREVLWEAPVENEEDARSGRLRGEGDGDHRGEMMAIRYRNIRKDVDQRDYFLDLGRSLLPYIHQALDERKLTPEFVQQWGKIMFCHGYLAAHYFDDGDDFARARHGKKKERHTHRKWLAHMMLPLLNKGVPRTRAEDAVARYVRGMLKDGPIPDGFERRWFELLLPEKSAGADSLRTTYNGKHFHKTDMERLVQEPPNGIPPVPVISP